MNELIKILPEPEARAEAKFILHALGVKYGDPVPEIAYEIARKRTETGEPIQYIVGKVQFMDLEFKVDKNVLIPRDETEFLVLEAKKIIATLTSLPVRILDIGTGSGIIPIVLGKIFNKKIEALGVDISTGALGVAIENAGTHLESNIALFRKSDLFSNVKETFDVIISNPPYVPRSENVQKELLFEPPQALFTKDALGVEFYEKIIKECPKHLNKGGYILFELGINQASVVEKMLRENGFSNIETTRDLIGVERVIKALYM